MHMTGKEIVKAFCFYQGYGQWTLKEKELIMAIDDEQNKLKKEIRNLKKDKKELRQIKKAWNEGLI